jgi:hypothetical protein
MTVAIALLGLLPVAACSSAEQGAQSTQQASQPQPASSSASQSATASAVVSSTPAAVPELKILSPKPGAEVELPAAIHYEVTGNETGYLRVFIDNPGTGFHIDLPFGGPSGVVYLPDDKQLSGMRDVTFWLTGPDHRLLANREAHVTINNLLLMGGRN